MVGPTRRHHRDLRRTSPIAGSIENCTLNSWTAHGGVRRFAVKALLFVPNACATRSDARPGRARARDDYRPGVGSGGGRGERVAAAIAQRKSFGAHNKTPRRGGVSNQRHVPASAGLRDDTPLREISHLLLRDGGALAQRLASIWRMRSLVTRTLASSPRACGGVSRFRERMRSTSPRAASRVEISLHTSPSRIDRASDGATVDLSSMKSPRCGRRRRDRVSIESLLAILRSCGSSPRGISIFSATSGSGSSRFLEDRAEQVILLIVRSCAPYAIVRAWSAIERVIACRSPCRVVGTCTAAVFELVDGLHQPICLPVRSRNAAAVRYFFAIEITSAGSPRHLALAWRASPRRWTSACLISFKSFK